VIKHCIEIQQMLINSELITICIFKHKKVSSCSVPSIPRLSWRSQ
jgi:hypothetical protein